MSSVQELSTPPGPFGGQPSRKIFQLHRITPYRRNHGGLVPIDNLLWKKNVIRDDLWKNDVGHVDVLQTFEGVSVLQAVKCM